MVKVVSLFLIAMLVLGMFGKLSILLPKALKKKKSIKNAKKCKSCGSYIVGNAPCVCKSGKKS